MQLLRMTTRRWMIAVLIASVLLGGFVMLRRAAHFMRLAVLHEDLAHHLRSTTGPSVGVSAANQPGSCSPEPALR
jgi:hypothetical protein